LQLSFEVSYHVAVHLAKQFQMRRVFSVLGFPFPVTREFWSGKVDFQTLVVREQVNFNYWIEELISNDFKTFSFA
jgi:hypothetical protein